MSWFFDKDDPFVVSMREYCGALQHEIPENSVSVGPWNKGKTLTEDHKKKNRCS